MGHNLCRRESGNSKIRDLEHHADSITQFVIAINCLGIKWFGEIEFWLSFIKIITLTGLILLGLIIDLGGVPGQERIGFRYWTDGRAFKPYKVLDNVGLGRFLGFVNALVLALFAYMGTELIGVTVGEAKVSSPCQSPLWMKKHS